MLWTDVVLKLALKPRQKNKNKKPSCYFLYRGAVEASWGLEAGQRTLAL